MEHSQRKHRGVSYPAFVIAVFLALAGSGAAIVCFYFLHESNQTNYQAVQQVTAAISKLPERPDTIEFKDAISILQAQFDSYQTSMSLTLTVAGAVLTIFGIAVPLMNYIFFQKETVDRIQAAMDKQQIAFDSELSRLKNSIIQSQEVTATLADKEKHRPRLDPISETRNDKADAYYIEARLALSPEHKVWLLRKAQNLNPNDYRIYWMLADVYNYELPDHKKRLRNLTKTLKIVEKQFGENSLKAAYFDRQISKVLCERETDLNRALVLAQKSVDISKRVLASDDPYIASMYINLANCYRELGARDNSNYDKAIEYYKEAISIYEKTYGSEHPDTAMSYDNLAYTYQKMGDLETALRYRLQAANAVKTLGSTATRYANIYSHVADTLILTGLKNNIYEALLHYLDAYRVYKDTRGKEEDADKCLEKMEKAFQQTEDRFGGLSFHEWLDTKAGEK